VLVAEDGADNRRLLERVLGQLGADTTFVDDGAKAVTAAVDAWRADEPFDVIYMDSQMPETDGLSATRTLRAGGYPGIIIALTADAHEGNREECLEAGCDEFLTKPIDRDALLNTTLDLLDRKSTS
jgi:CheY-like chemotaxis protein